MRAPSPLLRVLLCLALLGIALAGSLVVASVLGAAAAVAYTVLVVLLVVLGVVRGRRALAPTYVAPSDLPPGHTCSCCTTSQHDPVRIV